MNIINRKVVRTKKYRLLNLLRFIDEDSSSPIDIVGKVMIDVDNRKIFVITRPYQIYAWDYYSYYEIMLDLVWNNWRNIACYGDRETMSRNVSNKYFILDEESSKKIVSFTDPISSVPFIDDLFGLSYKVNYNLLTNLYLECVESLSKENKTSKTTSTLPSQEVLMESEYYDLVARFGNDMQIRWQHLQPDVWADEPMVEFFDLPMIPTPIDVGLSNETSVGEISTSPF